MTSKQKKTLKIVFGILATGAAVVGIGYGVKVKSTYVIKRPFSEGTTAAHNKEIITMWSTLKNGGIVRWGKHGAVKALTEPYNRETAKPAVELGYINMLVKELIFDYIHHRLDAGKSHAGISLGWPKLTDPKTLKTN